VVSYKLIGGFILFYNGFLTVSENLIWNLWVFLFSKVLKKKVWFLNSYQKHLQNSS
jgi:hypothetical protein